MDCQYVDFRATRSFSSFFLDYIDRHPALTEFYSAYPEPGSFKNVIETKRKLYAANMRQALCADLERQYDGIKLPEAVRKNLGLLSRETTFTVTTGHQLNLFTGPLYVIYKIVTVINACRKLKAAHPKFDFVPVYWMASEDHDFEEVSHFRLFGQTYRWDSGQTGAVGRMNSAGLKAWMDQVPGETGVFRDAYTRGKTLADAARLYMTSLFGEMGLITIDADNPSLKKFLLPVIEDDLFQHTAKIKVDRSSKVLKEAGFETHVHAREINLFYIDDGRRERIEADGNDFVLVDSRETISREAMKKLIASEPHKLSPNVILRPLYQEIILPNLAYVGGPAEVVYWLQLKSTFDHFAVPYPVVMPRNFALVVDGPSARKWEKTGLAWSELFQDKSTLFNSFARKNGQHRLTLDKEKEHLSAQFSALRAEAVRLDATLGPFIEAERKRSIASLEKIEHKMLRAEKRRMSDRLRQVESVKDSLFPDGSLQERTDNFLNYYQANSRFIQDLSTIFNPFDFRFHLLLNP